MGTKRHNTKREVAVVLSPVVAPEALWSKGTKKAQIGLSGVRCLGQVIDF